MGNKQSRRRQEGGSAVGQSVGEQEDAVVHTQWPCGGEAICRVAQGTASAEDYPIGGATQMRPPREAPRRGPADGCRRDFVGFGEDVAAPVALVGGKAKHLMELSALLRASGGPFSVPDGCVITTLAYVFSPINHFNIFVLFLISLSLLYIFLLKISKLC